jgi:hypothetical protein
MYLSGLLSEPRKCIRGHSSVSAVPGIFAIPEVMALATNPMSNVSGQKMVQNTGRLYTVKLFVCDMCGSIELVDAEKA